MKNGKDKYRHLIENLPDAFAYHQVVTDEEGAPVDYVFLEINDAFEEMTGLKRDEVIGKKVTAALPGIEKLDFDWIGTYGRIAQSNDSTCFQQCAELLGRWYEVAAYSCEPGYFATVFHDITEHKRTETKILESKRNLKETTQRWQHILSITGTGFNVIDAHYNLHYVDSLWQKVYGKPAGRKCYEYFKDRNSPCETCGIPRALATKQVILSEQVLPKENNRIVEVHTTPFQNPQGEWLVDEFKIDITERKRVEQALKESETKKRKADVETSRQSSRAESLLQIASRLNATLDLKAVLRLACEETCAALNVPLSAFLLYDSKNQAFHLADSSGLPPGFANSMKPLPQAVYDELVQKWGKSSVIPILAHVPDLPYAELFREHGIKSYAYAFLERDAFPVGLLVAGAAEEEYILTEDGPELLSGLANQAASAIDNARLFAEAQERLRQLQALRNIDMAITGSLNLRVTFQVVLDEVTSMLKTDAAAILSLDSYSGTLKYDSWRGFRTKDLKNVRLPLGEGYGGRSASKRQSIQIPDLREVEPDLVQGPLMAKEGFLAYYAVPLITKGTVRGVLEIFHREPLNSSQDWMTFLESLAGQAAVAIDNAELFHELEHSNVDLLRAYDATIEGWAYALDLKDEETEDHSRRVTEMTLHLAREMGMKDEELAHVRRGALLHDIGKMGIPDEILLKPSKLSGDEWEVMRRHPRYAFDMLSSIDYLRPALDIPYCHHEKWDGSGYPRGLKGKEISLAARIFAVVDVFDALTSRRPYRKAWSRKETLEHIRNQSGSHFDPQVVEVFLKEIDNLI